MSKELAISAGGAALGFFVGGPTGAALGWTLASYATAESPDVGQARIGDLRFQTSEYGVIIPYVQGSARVSGNVIWATEKVPYEKSSGGGKGEPPETIVIGYRINCAIAICAGPIDGITRFWEDGTLKGDGSQGQNKLPGTLYYGDDTQLPDSTMEAHDGVGNVPAYRGIAYLVLENFDMGTGGRLPMFSFEVIKRTAL